MVTDLELLQKQSDFNRLMKKLQAGTITRKEEVQRLEIIIWQVENKVMALMPSNGKSTKFVKMIVE